ncbi:L-galactono-1,4-lactone dehydrogenase-like protein [Coccomyxa subellipsoidea C-169]|uniref:L-galactono-1,4-lactone dehydrogenase-like protein n=1 Tax=Coccomyxa subellipsoidea (strain C-169) TaxID=574566 RepID=I0YMW6_COCSC|nr:L-galactono-1,4-lactone dehydrogenase-like protein [Coccomyxa subellipsoidea C-169]EIE19735.1 L-galactono-1,4-lactone dehydrogenase-like protein [Coccomyxa subellipsoidea C-169]|eukprot:XP_005644279.1 L-galactono-1,4-lactone dehydrogenase-like protein [Coccomyxa subellipsoidea C-169]
MNQLTGDKDEHHLVNWSNTHECRPKRFYQPETQEELEAIVREAHEKGEKLRCMGSGLSPNGLPFSDEGIVSLALLDKVKFLDLQRRRVTVEAGIRVEQLVEELRQHGLTLLNYASIREQSIGGFTQVSAHGTGATIPPVDEFVVGLKLVTPGKGTISLTREDDPEKFKLANVGLGALGIVSEVTLQLAPMHQLLEHTSVMKHNKLMQKNRHLRYMWIPYTDSVVVVTNNRVKEGTKVPKVKVTYARDEKLEPLRHLLREALPDKDPSTSEEVASLSNTQLRDRLIAHKPLDRDWIARINQAEAEYWKRSEGYRVGWSDEILGFDCGGEQWVLEVAFPTGTLKKPSHADLNFMKDLMQQIEENGIPAASPIEQRWTASSSSPMSPAAARGQPDTVHSWVGIIMYLPTEEEAQRKAITDRFFEYCKLVEQKLVPKYDATEHWAKIEVPYLDKQAARERIAGRYPVDKFNAARRELDPKNILANDIIDTLMPRSDILAVGSSTDAPAVPAASASL